MAVSTGYTPSVVSLFSGAGGLDIGLEQAGFSVVSALDFDANCVETLRRNQAKRWKIPGYRGRRYLDGAKIVHGNIEQMSARELKPGGAAKNWAPDLLVGGPPCQPFSSAGKQRGLDDPRGTLFHHFVRIAEELRPRFMLLENVRGLVTARGPSGEPGEVLMRVRAEFEAAGYATRFSLLNAADYGAPQRRVRLFMLASRVSPLPEFPRPTHAREPDESLFGAARHWLSLGELLAREDLPVEEPDLIRPSANLAALLKDVPEGSGLKSPGARETTRPGGHWGYKQGTFVADLSLPARTVTASSTQDWIRGKGGNLRRLTWRECAAIQEFPREWEFSGDRSSAYKQIGNAVPTVFGRVLGEEIMRAIENEHRRISPKSAPFPEAIAKAIRYTQREIFRNGESRERVKTEAAAGVSIDEIKGLGNAEGP